MFLKVSNSKGVCPDLQSGQVDASCQMSEPVCRFRLTDISENHVVYDDYRLRFF